MKPKSRTVEIYDTTLRDGSQAVGINFSLSDKLRIARRLHETGVHYIEGGFPARERREAEFFRKAAGEPFGARLVVFGSTRRKGTTCAKDEGLRLLLETKAPGATIVGKSWDLHVKQLLRTSLSENLEMIGESVTYLKRRMERVFFDAEHFFDGLRSNPDYALATIRTAMEAGADCVVLCDTNGGTMPVEFQQMFRRSRAAVEGVLGVHTHNDAGCADANTFLAVTEGARHVQGTVNGLGERCGNANLCTVVPGLQLKMGRRVLSDRRLRKLTETSVFVTEIANVAHNIRQPYVGESAFSHKGGMHIDGVRKNTVSFEHIDPSLVGNFRRFVVSDQAGAGTILEKLKGVTSGLDKKDPVVRGILSRILRMEAEGYQFEAAEGTFELIAREMMGMFEETFEFKGFRVIEEKTREGDVFSEATIKVRKGDDLEHTAAEGDGPVNALDNALRKALVKFYPSLGEVRLEDFKVRVLDEKEGTAAKVRVLIESSDGVDRWGTIGVSTNIIEASWFALVDGLRYKLMKDTVRHRGQASAGK